MVGSAEDVARFAAALQAGKLLGPAARAEMVRNQLSPEVVTATLGGQLAPVEWGYGLGLQTGKARRADAVLHTGLGAGATNVFYWLPQQDTAVVALSNIESSESAILALADAVADIVSPAPVALVSGAS
jgi:CubicO group peptidase (beta-lactamase class C family)